MEFNINKVYSDANADKIPTGSYCFFADSVGTLRLWVESECMECATQLCYIKDENLSKRFCNIRNEDASLAYLLSEDFMDEEYYLTTRQINRMRDVLPFIDGKSIDTYEIGDYRITVDFYASDRTHSKFDMTPEVTVENKNWKSSLTGNFKNKFMHIEDHHYLTNLSAGSNYPDVVVSDEIVKEINKAFFSVFNDEYIKNLEDKKKEAEEDKKKEATDNFFNNQEQESNIIHKSSFIDKIKEKLYNIFS